MILSAAMLLQWLGERHADPHAAKAALRIEKAVSTALATGAARTPDIGGTATTHEAGDTVLKAL